MTQTSNPQIRLRCLVRWSVICSLIACFICPIFSYTENIQEKTVYFSVRAGKAADSLKEIARQADVDIVFPGRLLRKVRTPAVEGEYALEEVFDLMLAGTSLAVFQHVESGVYTIREAETNYENGNAKLESTIPMKEMKRTKGGLLKGLLALALVSAPNVNSQDDEDSVYELSPFEVNAGDQDGYLASTTLAGTRLSTPLRDVGAAVTAVTKQFIEDTASTDLTELLIYTVNTESSGLDGNSLGEVPVAAGGNAGLLQEATTRRNPQSAMRARGLANMDRSRNYFTTVIPSDSYNMSRVDIARGANALLFGLGSPAGVVNTTTIKASSREDHGEVGFRVGSYGSNRATLDYNKVIIPDKWAVRLALLRDDKKYIQKPAFEKDERIFLTTSANIFQNDTNTSQLRFTGSYETGKIDALRPRRQGPGDRVNQWLIAGSPERFAHMDTTRPNFPSAFLPKDHPDYQVPPGDWEARIDPIRNSLDIDTSYFDRNFRLFQNQVFRQSALVYDADSAEPIDIGHVSQRHSSWFDAGNPNNLPTGTLNYWTIDYAYRYSTQAVRVTSFPLSQYDHIHNLVGGNHGGAEADLDAIDLSLEGNFLSNNLGFELSFSNNTYEDIFERPFSYGGNSYIYVDPNRTYIDGRPNPNYGRMFLSPSTNRSEGYNEQEAFRLTAYAAFDFREKMDGVFGSVLGHHRLIGLISDHEQYDQNLGSNLAFVGPESVIATGGRSDILHSERSVSQYLYFGPSIAGATPYETPIEPNITYIPPEAGQTYPVSIWDRNISDFRTTNLTTTRVYQNGSNFERLETSSNAITLQSNWLNDSIVTIAGWREDTADNFTPPNILPRQSQEHGVDIDAVVLSPEDTVKGDIWTYSAVAHVTDWFDSPLGLNLSLHYGQSENFQPEAGDINIFGELIQPPGGDTQERGFTIGTRDNRSTLRVNWYESNIVNSRQTSVSTVVNAIRSLDLQTLGFWYEIVNEVQNGWITQEHINFLESNIPQGFLDANGWQVIDGVGSYSNGSFSDTSTIAAEGMEIEGTFNINPNWRLHLNVSKTKAVASDIAPSVSRYIADHINVWGNASTGVTTPISELPRNPVSFPHIDDVDNEAYPEIGSWESLSERAVSTIAALDELNRLNGADNSRLREWRYNVVTNYSFPAESRFKGFGLGAAYRWEDETIINYRNKALVLNPGTEFEDTISVPNFDDPIISPSRDNVDLWVSYRRKIFDDRVDWRVQFNVRNTFADDGLIPTSFTATGIATAFITTPPRTWSLSSNFHF